MCLTPALHAATSCQPDILTSGLAQPHPTHAWQAVNDLLGVTWWVLRLSLKGRPCTQAELERLGIAILRDLAGRRKEVVQTSRVGVSQAGMLSVALRQRKHG